MKKLYNFFLNIGQQSSFSLLENKKIKLLNIYVLITIHFIVIMPIGDVITGILTVKIVCCYFVLFLFMLLVLFLNKKQKHYLAISIWLGIVLFAVFMFSIVLLPESYVEYYYVFIPGIALTLFTKNIIPVIVTLFSLFLFFIPYYIIVVYPPSIVNKLDPFAVLGLFACVYLLVNHFKKINTENEEKLEETYKILEDVKKVELDSLKLKLIRNSMNPHFIFNTMNSVQNLVIKGEVVETYNYLSKLSSLIRDNFNSGENIYISFDDEFSMLKKYLGLESLRFDEKGEYHLDKGNVLGSIQIPSMMIQPFIENSIYRMFHNVKETNQISIKFHQNNFLICTITDNGIGFNEVELLSQKDDLKESSLDLKNIENIKEHIVLLKELYKMDISFKYVFLNSKVQCIVTIPYKNTL